MDIPKWFNIPEALKQHPHFALWKLEKGKDDILKKVPYSANYNGRAKSNDPNTWCTFQKALEKWKRFPDEYNGIAFFMTPDIGFVFIDGDHCITPEGVVADEAETLINEFPDTYIEISQSREGLHIFAGGTIPRGIKNSKTGIEMYNKGRFVALTGNSLNGIMKVTDCQDAIDRLFEANDTKKEKDKTHSIGDDCASTHTMSLDTRQIIEKAKSHPTTGSRFTALFKGDITGYGSQSEADMALCNSLAFWLDRDPDKMDEVFRMSGLYRDKWNRNDYRTDTITQACNDCDESYSESLERHQAERCLVRTGDNGVDVANEPNPIVLEKNDKGNPANTIENVTRILEHDKDLVGKIWWNTFTQSHFVRGSLPWVGNDNFREWQDFDDDCLNHLVEHRYGIGNKQKILQGLNIVAGSHKFNPIVDALESLPEWDGQPHIVNLFPDFLGVEKNDYTTETVKLLFLGAISRAFEPGCKFDYCIVLIGFQGAGKTTMFNKLALCDEWFGESFQSLEGKDAMENLRGKWIVELGELSALKRAKDVEGIKAFLSKRSDFYRPSYGSRSRNFPRQCVFVGTTNQAEFLIDATGNRRFLPLVCKKENITRSIFNDAELLNAEIQQCWAEALHIYKAEHPHLVLPIELQPEAERVQQQHREANVKVGIIQEYLDHKLDGRTCVMDCWENALGNTMKKPTNQESREIASILRNDIEGWEELGIRQCGDYGKQKSWARIEEPFEG